MLFVNEQKKKRMRVEKSNCSFTEYKRGEGNKLFTPNGKVFLCNTNLEIKQPNFLILSTNKRKKVLGNYQALIKNKVAVSNSFPKYIFNNFSNKRIILNFWQT